MKNVDATVIKETKYVAIWVLMLSVLMQAVFLVIGHWDYTVLLGNLLSGSAVIFNFFLMGIGIQRALEKEEREAKAAMKVSQLYRFLFLAVIVIIGVLLPCFSTWTTVIPMLFTNIAVVFRPLFDKKK